MNSARILQALKNTWNQVVTIDKKLDWYAPLWILLLLVVLLRVGNLSETHWYGDEGMYLTIGQTLNDSAVLYKDIVDHKTPLIYFLAQVGTQLNFRLLLIVWMLGATVFYYLSTLRILGNRAYATIATLLFVLATTLPTLEGNIPNGELFMMGFVLAGGLVILHSASAQAFFADTRIGPLAATSTKRERRLFFAAGVFFGLGILTKVPALFDLVAFASLGFLAISNRFAIRQFAIKKTADELRALARLYAYLAAGVFAPIALSLGYFAVRGALGEYLDIGVLYNIRYAGFWQPDLHPFLQTLVSLPVKALIAGLFILALLLSKQYMRRTTQFAAIWLVLALFASTLSNRPYPHYFLQIVPAAALLIASVIPDVRAVARLLIQPARPTQPTRPTQPNSVGQKLQSIAHYLKKNWSLFVVIDASILTIATLVLLGVSGYPTLSYYRNFALLQNDQISVHEYRQSFDSIVPDTYRAAEILRHYDQQQTVVWGNNPMIYALSEARPIGRFTAAFHVFDFNALAETYQAITTQQPDFIIVMRNHSDSFAQLNQLLQDEYLVYEELEHLTVWKKHTLL